MLCSLQHQSACTYQIRGYDLSLFWLCVHLVQCELKGRKPLFCFPLVLAITYCFAKLQKSALILAFSFIIQKLKARKSQIFLILKNKVISTGNSSIVFQYFKNMSYWQLAAIRAQSFLNIDSFCQHRATNPMFFKNKYFCVLGDLVFQYFKNMRANNQSHIVFQI